MCKEKFGIEMEVISKISNTAIRTKIGTVTGREKVSINTAYHSHEMSKWGVESDGSINASGNYSYTAELITPPLKINELGQVKKVLDSMKSQLSVNSSCGLHVHVEIDSVQSLKAVLLIWRKFENKIIKTFPKSRRLNNRFCKRLYRMDLDNMLNFQFDRYHMVNPNSYHSKSTVEFRSHAGTVNYNKIKRWVLFVTKLVETAKTYQDKLSELATKLQDAGDSELWDFIGLKNTKTEKYMEARIIHFGKIAA